MDLITNTAGALTRATDAMLKAARRLETQLDERGGILERTEAAEVALGRLQPEDVAHRLVERLDARRHSLGPGHSTPEQRTAAYQLQNTINRVQHHARTLRCALRDLED